MEFFKNILFYPGLNYSFWFRLTSFTENNKFLNKSPFYLLLILIIRSKKYRFGIDIPPTTNIGSGLYIGHFGGIIINGSCTIGKNLNISQGVTIGKSNRGKRKGVPIIGDNVYIGPGAKLIGGIKIGDNVAIGANCVVINDVPCDAVVVGIPGKIISYKGSVGYINFTN